MKKITLIGIDNQIENLRLAMLHVDNEMPQILSIDDEENNFLQTSSYTLNLGMGHVQNPDSLSFLEKKHIDAINSIGYSGKLKGEKTTIKDYLNTLDKGVFSLTKTKYDNGDFQEQYIIFRLHLKQ